MNIDVTVYIGQFVLVSEHSTQAHCVTELSSTHSKPAHQKLMK